MEHHYGVIGPVSSTPFWRVAEEHRFGAQGSMGSGNNIQALREAKGWSRPELGKRMATSGQQIERLEKGMRKLSQDWIERAAAALEVQPIAIIGEMPVAAPPVPPEGSIADLPESNGIPFQVEDRGNNRMYQDLPIYGTALGADEIIDGEAIEQTTLNRAEIVERKRRPPILDGRSDVYGLIVQGSSMEPVHRDGSTVIAESRKRPAIGDDAVVYLRGPDGDEGELVERVLIKRVIRKTASYLELQQFNPEKIFRIEMVRVSRMDRILTLDDLIG